MATAVQCKALMKGTDPSSSVRTPHTVRFNRKKTYRENIDGAYISLGDCAQFLFKNRIESPRNILESATNTVLM